ncbi:MAG: hypothetical protein LW721_14765 [Flammeovirgaceae bacterium]|jgi:hypothetical protein|nr:hypothetical protein [Flammeovirgaceae bacterium]
MSRAVIVFIFACCGLLFGCNTQKKICPAYQSAFIFDKSSQKEAFVYYNANKSQAREVLASNSKTLTLPANDSTWEKSVVLPGPALPKERKTKKTRYLLVPKKTYKKALRALQTIEMKPVYPKKPTDSVDIKKALDSAARSITDTLSSHANADKQEEKDSTYVISIEKEKFNVDQENYMWYFRKILVLPDVRIALEGAKEEAGASKKSAKKGGFFKNLFKKKDKKAKMPVKDKVKLVDQPIDSTGAVPDAPQAVKKKKGVFGFLKKKSADAGPPKKAEPKKEEEEKF